MSDKKVVQNDGEEAGIRKDLASDDLALTPALTRSRPLARSPGDLRSATAEQIPFAASQAAQVSPRVGEGEAKVAKRKHGPGHLLVGKIARLPKSIREQINRRIEDGQPASVIGPWLNGLPAVKKVLSAHFGGVEINQKNISNWTSTGYKRWLEKQEFVMELRALSEDATDFTRAAGAQLARGTACIAAAKIVKMLRGMKPEDCTPDQLIKIAYATTALVQAEQNNERLKNEKTRVFQGNERLVLSWDKHMRNCAEIGLRIMDDWQAKAVHEAPFDNTVKIELLGRRMFGHLWRKRKLPGEDHIPGNVGDEEPVGTGGPIASPGAPLDTTPGVSTNEDHMQASDGGQNWTDGTDEVEAQAKAEPEKTAATQRGPTMTPEAAREDSRPTMSATASAPLPVNPYAGRSTQDVIAEIEGN
jgi:hypothetical protein